MWDYRFRKASGTTVKDKSSSESLSQGQFLALERPDMIYYTTSPQNTPLGAPKLPDSYFNIAKVKSLSTSISVPSKQHIIQETVCRENVQILGHVVWFQMAIEELRISRSHDKIFTTPGFSYFLLRDSSGHSSEAKHDFGLQYPPCK